MKEELFVITAVSVLTGYRVEISGPMPREAAEARLQRERESRRYQKYQPYKQLRVEKRLPVQLLLKFEER